MVLALLVSVSVAGPGPVVVRTVPENLDIAVDPALREIVVVYDRPMSRNGDWSVVGGGRTFPADGDGDLHWSDERTFVFPVHLEPDRAYALGFNGGRFTGFRSEEGDVAEPYHLVFTTRADPPPPGREPNRRAAARLVGLMERDNAHVDLSPPDWRERLERLAAAPSARAFAAQAALALSPTCDQHLWFTVGRIRYGAADWCRLGPGGGFARSRLDRYELPALSWRWEEGAALAWLGDVAVLRIPGWDAATASVPALISRLAAQHPGARLIVDVRENGGGDERRAMDVAACFATSEVVYAKARVRDGGHWTDTFERSLRPDPGCHWPAERTIVLQDRGGLSSNESFLLMMREAGVTTLGETSGGSSGRAVRHRVGHGVSVWLPSWEDFDRHGAPIEGHGVRPDVEVPGSDGAEDVALVEACRRLGGCL